MISVFIMYSADRIIQLAKTIDFLKQMDLYEDCQKTLVVDGKTNVCPAGFNIIQVPRYHGQFCWSRMWEAGVATSQYENIVYLDSDRLLPKSFLLQVFENIKDNAFLFTSRHFYLLNSEINQSLLEKFVNSDAANMLHEVVGQIKFEIRHKEPLYGPGKNVMSGSTAFTKNTFYNLGGVDPWYCGHGAFADSDFHFQAATHGCEFIDLQLTEVHCGHEKQENNVNLSQRDLHVLSLKNFIYYINKWNLPISLAEDMAVNCKIENPKEFVAIELAKVVG